MTIRVGIESDLERAFELIKELAVYEKEPDAVVTTVESMRRDGFGDNSIFGFFVAEDDDKNVVGLSLYYYRYSTWKGKRLYLEDLIVTESARGKGYGQALFDATLRHSIEQECTGMMWQVLDWNEHAIGFYKSYGAELDSAWVNCHLDRKQIDSYLNAAT